ncbi:MBL fold metallo-hydrolase [Methylobacillus flagellatus]|uniref:Beta-lactamase-like protein n=1 Tax=Methylobacillus flagellatus (strain ATCC 51484 / DSM 6875 / VKM B-1610 / KT) TaxID=265072 RepID=Q1GZA2_METFK|nr:MBL fold metallo-hydrolase [Methylobacillus flagellatus]ABE50435.1 beta-lactamase-like protein [Methylobacillus flagellatus KT]
MNGQVKAFYDQATSTVSYVVFDEPGGYCAVIDPVLDFDPRSARTSTTSADRIAAFVKEMDLTTVWLLETHVHADHISAAPYLKKRLGGSIAIGSEVQSVLGKFNLIYNTVDTEFAGFDQLFDNGQMFFIGKLKVIAHHVPGHTPADTAYEVDHVGIFVGDTIFMPDVGTARCDFPGGDPRRLYRSIKTLLNYPPDTILYTCHDYPVDGREARWSSTIAEQRSSNIHIHDGVDEAEFCRMRNLRDATLALPALMLAAVQVNLRAGQFPEAEDNGVQYLRIPLNLL